MEIDDIDEPCGDEIEEEVEGFDVQEVMDDPKKRAFLEKLLHSLPPYFYCSTDEEKAEFFINLNKEFLEEIDAETVKLPHSHSKKVNFNFTQAQTVGTNRLNYLQTDRFANSLACLLLFTHFFLQNSITLRLSPTSVNSLSFMAFYKKMRKQKKLKMWKLKK